MSGPERRALRSIGAPVPARYPRARSVAYSVLSGATLVWLLHLCGELAR